MRAASGPYSAADVASACRGLVLQGDRATSFDAISTDSRDIRSNDLFVPLVGANFDGHEFLLPALEAGARGSLLDRDANREIPEHLTNRVLIQVQDTLLALSDLASAHRKTYHTPLIAVTGSSGKTTVKEMIACVLRRSESALISEGNLNNLVGLPMTVLNLGPNHTVAVVEAGINRIGEMDALARACAPDTAVITSIGPVHLEGLKSVETVAVEKFKLAQALRIGGVAVLPHADPYLAPLLGGCRGSIVTFGLDGGDFTGKHVRIGEEIVFEMVSPVGVAEISLSTRGRHNVSNALAALAACISVGVDMSDAVEGLREFRSPPMRMEIISLARNRRLLRDCYNANPQSLKAALEVLAGFGSASRNLAVLADMMELGEQSAQLHEEIGRFSAELGIGQVVFVGESGKFFSRGFLSAGGSAEGLALAADKDMAWEMISGDIERFDTILVKGSRAMKMEIIADRIMQEN